MRSCHQGDILLRNQSHQNGSDGLYRPSWAVDEKWFGVLDVKLESQTPSFLSFLLFSLIFASCFLCSVCPHPSFCTLISLLLGYSLILDILYPLFTWLTLLSLPCFPPFPIQVQYFAFTFPQSNKLLQGIVVSNRCAAQYSTHEPHVLTEHLKCG